MIMEEHQYLDPATAEFVNGFRRDLLSSVRNLSGEFDHSRKARRATGGYSDVFVTHWTPQHSPPMQVSLSLPYCVYQTYGHHVF